MSDLPLTQTCEVLKTSQVDHYFLLSDFPFAIPMYSRKDLSFPWQNELQKNQIEPFIKFKSYLFKMSHLFEAE